MTHLNELLKEIKKVQKWANQVHHISRKFVKSKKKKKK